MTAFEKAWNISKQTDPIDWDDPCPYCKSAGDHEMIDYGMDGVYFQKYQCNDCSGIWENRYAFEETVLESGDQSPPEPASKGTSTDDIMAGMSEEERARYRQFLEHEYEHDEEGNPI